ncbi:MAG: hypothetical protein ACRDRE_22265, partial [Pseudonocardiaceae bacterium]
RRRPPTATTNPLTRSPFNTTAAGFDSKEQSFINNTPRLDTEEDIRRWYPSFTRTPDTAALTT